MKKIILIISLIVLPTSSVFAAFNNATLTTDAVISVDSYTLNISGSSAVVESITVNLSNFSVTLQSGSSITITSPTKNQITTDITSGVTNICNSSVSSVAITGTGTYTITPTATICVDSTPTPEPTPTPSGGSSSGGSSSASSQVQSLISMGNYQLAQQIANKYNIVLPDSAPTLNTKTPSTVYKITTTKVLSVGQTNADIKTLQQYLNLKGYTVATTGVGSKGKETTMFGALTKKALMKLQKANGIPATGNLGPLTRAFINAHP
jgi:hypothetical protein